MTNDAFMMGWGSGAFFIGMLQFFFPRSSSLPTAIGCVLGSCIAIVTNHV
jgi:hypothetical protein